MVGGWGEHLSSDVLFVSKGMFNKKIMNKSAVAKHSSGEAANRDKGGRKPEKEK